MNNNMKNINVTENTTNTNTTNTIKEETTMTNNLVMNHLYLRDYSAANTKGLKPQTVDNKNIDLLNLRACITELVEENIAIDPEKTYYVYTMITRETCHNDVSYELSVVVGEENRDFVKEHCFPTYFPEWYDPTDRYDFQHVYTGLPFMPDNEASQILHKLFEEV